MLETVDGTVTVQVRPVLHHHFINFQIL